MGWLIALGIIAAYGGIGLLCIPFIARRRLASHRQGYRCDNCAYTYRTDRTEESMRDCATQWAGIAWMIWPICLLIGIPKVLATGALTKDAEKATRLKVLEAEAAETEKGIQRELAILRSGDPLTMTKADFDRKMLEADPVPKKTKRTLTSRLPIPFG